MSKKAAEDFIEASQKEGKILDALRKNPEKIHEIAKEHGYEFSEEEFKHCLAEYEKKGRPAHFCNNYHH